MESASPEAQLTDMSSTSGAPNKDVVGVLRLALQRLVGDQLATRLLGPGLIALVIKIASAALSYAMFVAFARMLNAEEYGHFGQMLNLAIVVAAAAGVGLPTAVMRFWPGHVAKGELTLAKGFHHNAQWALLTAGCILVAAGFLAAFVVPAKTLGFAWGILAVTVLGVLFAAGDYYSSALRAQGLTTWSLLPRDIAWRVATPVLACAVLWWTGALGAGLSMAVCVLAMAVVAAAQGLRSAHATRTLLGDVVATKDWSAWRKPLMPMAGAALLFAMVQQLDVVVVGALVGAADAGAYFAAQKTASLLGLAMIAGGLVAAPLMSAAYQSDRRDELQRLCRLLGIGIAITTIVGLAVLAVIGGELLAIFDPTYRSAYPILMILAFGFAIDSLAGPSAYLMQMTSLEGSYLRLMAVVYAFVLSLQFALVPHFGVLAAAVASALGVCLWNFIAIRLLRQKIGVDPSVFGILKPPKENLR